MKISTMTACFLATISLLSASAHAEYALICGNEDEKKAIAHVVYQDLPTKEVDFLKSFGVYQTPKIVKTSTVGSQTQLKITTDNSIFTFAIPSALICDGDPDATTKASVMVTTNGRNSRVFNCLCYED